MAFGRQPVPVWFRVLSVLLLLWGMAACAAFYMHVTFDPSAPSVSDYDRQLYRSLPGWLGLVFAVAVGTVLLGAIALLARSRLAVPLFAVSLVAVVLQFGWTLGATDLIAVKGVFEAAAAPAFIFIMGCLALWLALTARRRRWIG